MTIRMQKRGFSLIEMLVVVAMIAIMAAWAVPTYVEHVARARRAQAQADLQNIVGKLEKYYSVNFAYTNLSVLLSGDVNATGNVWVKQGNRIHYEMSAERCDATTPLTRCVLLICDPASSQTKKYEGRLSLNTLGEVGWDKDKDGIEEKNGVEDCPEEQTWESNSGFC